MRLRRQRSSSPSPIAREGCQRILTLVAERPGLGIREVAEALGWTSPTDRQYAAITMRVMEAMGLLVAQPVEERRANSAPRMLWYPGLVTALDGPQLDRRQLLLAAHVLRTFVGTGALGQPSIDLLEHLEREADRLGWR